MYSTLLWIHSWWRWVVLVVGAVALVRVWAGVVGKRPWSAGTQRAVAACVGTLDLQFLLGVILYLFVSPLTAAAFRDMEGAMHNAPLRFWAVEHGPTMLLVTTLFHVGSARARRAANDAQRHRRLATWFTIATLLMLAAIPWPFLDIGRPLFR